MTEISPAILTNDISDFRKKYAELFALSHHFKELHVDFIDGKFLPNRTIMPGQDCRLKPPFRLTAHFMTLNPAQYFAIAKNDGYSTVIFQFEAMPNEAEVDRTVDLARTLGLRVGIAVNPETKLFAIAKFIDKVDVIQLMAIHPGAQGREFLSEIYEKIRELRQLSKNVIISVDGGVKVGIARQLSKAGADILVAGSAILRSEDEDLAIEALRADIETK